jgi:thioredoxin-like negative regulator of GroEL
MASKVPVILQCYADWCNPCHKLRPIIEEKVRASEGRLKLVLINIDLLPKISDSLGVKNIPAVFLVNRGNVADHFTGVPALDKLDDFINTGLLLEGMHKNKKLVD